MKAPTRRVTFVALACSLVLSAGIALAQDTTTQARKLLDFCIAHPEACSISVDYTNNGRGYRIDFNGTRLNPIASTYKVIDLLAYAEAVNERNIEPHHINPAEAVALADWARFWIGQDGGALANAYTRFSAGLPTPPTTVTNDQIVSAMIQESDNSAPDYLLNKLGGHFMEETVRRFVTNQNGYVDFPGSINAMFNIWTEGPPNPGTGPLALNNYSGFESDEFRGQISDMFGQMHDPAVMSAIRTYNGVIFPWSAGTAPPAQPFPLNDSQYETLTKNYSTRSNTRSYNNLMHSLLRRDLLPPGTQAIVEKFLEYRLSAVPANPQLANFDRYGAKDGDFATYNGETVRTRTIYAETRDGTQVVFTVHLVGTPGTPTDLSTLDTPIRDFALAVASDPTFALEVQNRLGPLDDAPAPGLIARIVKNTSTAERVKLRVAITNIGTERTQERLDLALYFSDDGTTLGREEDRKSFERLAPGETAHVDLDSLTGSATKFFILDIDPSNVIPAVQKQNNPQFELVPGH